MADDVPQLWTIDDAGITVPTSALLIDTTVKVLQGTDRLGGDYLFDPDDDMTQAIEVILLQVAKAYAFGLAVALSFDPEQATGVMLRDRGSIVGAEYASRSRSVVAGTLFGAAGTIVPSGTIFAYLPSENGDLWATFQPYVLGAGGTIPAELQAIEYGPVVAAAAPPSAWSLQTPVAGLQAPGGGFLSSASSSVGKLAATDLEVREAIRLAGRGGAGAATYDSDVQNVYALTGAPADNPRPSYVALFVNRTLIYDPDQDLAEKRGRFVVEGGRKQDILDAIATTESTGLNTTDTGQVVGTSTRFDGKLITTSYTRPTDVFVQFRVTVGGPNLPASQTEVEAVVFAAIETRIELQDVAEKVIPEQYKAAIIVAFGENVVESCVVEVRRSSGDPYQTTPLLLSQPLAERAKVHTGPTPAEILGLAEEPIDIAVGMTLNLEVNGNPEPVVFAQAQTTIAGVVLEIEAQAPDVDAIDSDGRLLLRTLTTGPTATLFINGGTAVAPLGLPSLVLFEGTDGDVEVIVA